MKPSAFSRNFLLTCMDPGKDTGLSLFRVTPETLRREESDVVRYDPDRGLTPLTTIKRWKQQFPDEPHVFLYENFHIRPGRAVPDTTAIPVIKEVELWIEEERPYTQVVKQIPVEGKRQVPNKILERMGLLLRGGITRHANDSTRHGVTWLIARGHRPTCLLAFPK